MADSVRDLVVKLSFEHGDTKAQISGIRNELRMMESGFAAAAAEAAASSGGFNQAGSAVDMLRQKLELQQQIVAKYGEAIEQANQKMQAAVQAHEKTGQKLEAEKAKREQLKGQIDQLKAAMAEEAAANGRSSEAYQQMEQQLESLQNELKASEQEVRRLEGAQTRTDQAMNRAAQSVNRLTRAQNEARQAVAQTQQQLQEEEARLRRNADAWERRAEAASRVSETAMNAGGWQTSLGRTLTRTSTAIVGMGAAAVKAAIDWESSFAGVRKTVNGTSEELAGIERQLLDMQVPTDYSDLADIAANAGQLGIATGNVVNFTRVVADLAETTDLSAESAAQSFAQYANITGMSQDNFDRLGSVTVELGNNLATTESKIVGFAQAIGAAGHQVGMTDQQIFGISGGLASLGLEAQAGGTAFSKAMVSMKVAVETGNEDLQKFATVCGMSSEQFKQAFNEDAAGTFIQFVAGLSSGSTSAIEMLTSMGITETRYRDMLLRASNASDLLTKAVDMANSAWTENVALTNEASVRYQTTAARMSMLKKSAQQTAMNFGNSLLPALESGMDVVSGIVDRFNALDESQRKSIITWAAYIAAMGPAISLIGTANKGIGAVASGLSSAFSAMASGGIPAVMQMIGSALGPAGVIAVATGAAIAAAKLIDVASGAAAAREAIKALNDQAKDWQETQAATLYDTGNANPLQRFGLSEGDFKGAKQDAEGWLDGLIKVWTDGKGETDQIVREWTEAFTGASDGVREAIEQQRALLTDYDALTPTARAKMDRDVEQLNAWDREIQSLLRKRQNGFLTEGEQQRLNEIVQARAELQVTYSLDAGSGYDQIITRMQAEVERLKASGEASDPTLFGDALNALAAGRRAYTESLNESYDAEYQQIQAIADETAQVKALEALNDRYNEKRQADEEAYQTAVKQAAVAAWENDGYSEQIRQIDELLAEIGKAGEMDFPKIKDIMSGMDEGKLASMIALVEQLRATGMSDTELLNLGIDVTDLKGKIEAIRNLSAEIEGLEDVNLMFGQALPEEITRIMIGLDMTQAAADWEAFAEGKTIIPTIAPEEGEGTEIDLTARIADIAIDGAKPEVDVDGRIVSLTTQEGVRFTDANGDGTVDSVTTAGGLTFQVDGTGHVTAVTLPDGTVIPLVGHISELDENVPRFDADGDGTIDTVEPADGVRFHCDGDGNVTSVDADGVTFTASGTGEINRVVLAYQQGLTVDATARVRLNPLDQAAISAWEAQISGITLNGPMAKVSVGLGANWREDLERAMNLGALNVYSGDGIQIPVTPEVVSRITATDVVAMDDDGTIHVIITPEVASAQAREMIQADYTAKPIANAPDWLSDSAADKVARIKALTQQVNYYTAAAKEAADAGDAMLAGNYNDSAAGVLQQVNEEVERLNDADLTTIGGQIASLMAALSSGTGTPEQIGEWTAELQGLMDFVQGIDPSMANSTGTNIMAGIAEGMRAYGWSGDAATVAAAIQSAVNASLGVASPSTLMMPTGAYVSAGIGQGMRQYSFSGDGATVSARVVAAFAGLPAQGRSIGYQFGAGLASGLNARLPGIVASARMAANQIAAAFRSAWQIRSPSKVAEGLTEMFGRGLEKGMEDWPRVSEAWLRGDIATAERGAQTVIQNTTDSRNMSVSAPINVERMEVRDERDIYAVSRELYELIRRDQKLVGG